jgi:hypothetical protein
MNIRISAAVSFAAGIFGGLVVLGIANAYRYNQVMPQSLWNKQYELLDVMHDLQRYAEKTFWAAEDVRGNKAAPWQIENQTERKMIATMLLPTLPALQKATEEERWTDFYNNYDTTIAACNVCHVANDHGFVRIKRPGSLFSTIKIFLWPRNDSNAIKTATCLFTELSRLLCRCEPISSAML